MSKLKNFFNFVSNDNRIYTAEDIGDMSAEDFGKYEKAIDYQMNNLGIPTKNDLIGNSDVVFVHSYTRRDGTQVKEHYRSKAGGCFVTNSEWQTNVGLKYPNDQDIYNQDGRLNDKYLPKEDETSNVNILETLSSLGLDVEKLAPYIPIIQIALPLLTKWGISVIDAVKGIIENSENIVDNVGEMSDGMTGAAANLRNSDIEFDRPLNYQIKDFDTKIPSYNNYMYYVEIKNKLENELGDFLRENTNAPQIYSNDLRHQYTSAIFARNLGQNEAKWLGNLNEVKDGPFSNIDDSEIDQINNKIGRDYALKYPYIPRKKLLKILLEDWEKNSEFVERLKKKHK